MQEYNITRTHICMYEIIMRTSSNHAHAQRVIKIIIIILALTYQHKNTKYTLQPATLNETFQQ